MGINWQQFHVYFYKQTNHQELDWELHWGAQLIFVDIGLTLQTFDCLFSHDFSVIIITQNHSKHNLNCKSQKLLEKQIENLSVVPVL